MDVMLQIREAIPEDSEDLKSCMESAYASYQNRLGGERLPPMDVDYSLEIKNYPTWVIESKASIVGGLIMAFENNEASIANIAVAPDSQGQGIGGALLNFAESTAKENDFTELHLVTHVLLSENISLYKHLGWEESCREESKIFMKKVI